MNCELIFTDGTVIEAEENGSCFITAEKPMFPDDFDSITVSDADGDHIYHYAILVECAPLDERYWFTFIEESKEERVIRELQEQNDMLTECILEMSEIVYGE